MNTVDLGAFHVNLGVRVELTNSSYTGNVAATDTVTGTTSVSPVTGTQNYTDVFPSVNVRYGIDENTNIRAAVTRAIARPNYGDLAPSITGNLGAIYQHTYANLSAGNPDLRPQHAWNYDLLFEHFMPSSGGVLSGGVFYKSLTDVILTRNFVYSGLFTAFDGYYRTEPSNGGSRPPVWHRGGLDSALPLLPWAPVGARGRPELHARELAGRDRPDGSRGAAAPAGARYRERRPALRSGAGVLPDRGGPITPPTSSRTATGVPRRAATRTFTTTPKSTHRSSTRCRRASGSRSRG